MHLLPVWFRIIVIIQYTMRKIILLIILFASFGSNSYSQTVEEIVNRHIQALGGRQALANVRTKVLELELQLDSGPMKAVVYNQRPDNYRSEMEMPDGNKVLTLVGPGGGWNQMGENAGEVSPEQMADLKLNELDIDGILVDYKAKGIEVSLAGKEKVNDAEAYKIKIELPNETTQWFWINSSNYMPLKLSRSVITGMGPMDLDREFLEFKEVKGVKYTVRFRSSFGMNEYTTIVKSIKINESIDPKVFERG